MQTNYQQKALSPYWIPNEYKWGYFSVLAGDPEKRDFSCDWGTNVTDGGPSPLWAVAHSGLPSCIFVGDAIKCCWKGYQKGDVTGWSSERRSFFCGIVLCPSLGLLIQQKWRPRPSSFFAHCICMICRINSGGSTTTLLWSKASYSMIRYFGKRTTWFFLEGAFFICFYFLCVLQPHRERNPWAACLFWILEFVVAIFTTCLYFSENIGAVCGGLKLLLSVELKCRTALFILNPFFMHVIWWSIESRTIWWVELWGVQAFASIKWAVPKIVEIVSFSLCIGPQSQREKAEKSAQRLEATLNQSSTFYIII